MAEFRIGEIGVGQHFTCDTELNGMEGEVIDVLPEGGTFRHWRTHAIETITCLCYEVRWSNGWSSFVAHYHLRKRPPRAIDQTVSWDACLWQPEKETA